MNVTIQPINSAQAKVKILVPAADVTLRMDSYFSSLAKKAKVPGFRPGKAPKDVVKKIYKDDVNSEITERLVSEFVIQAIQEKKLELSMPPRLLATDLPEENKDFNFEVEVDLKPLVPEISWSNLEIPGVENKAIGTDEIDAQIHRLQEAEAPFLDVTEKRESKNGDYIVVKFEGSVDGVKSAEMASENHAVVLGDGQFLPDFETGILGAKVGDKRTFNVTFPNDYQTENLRSKTAVFDVEVLGLKEKSLPIVDDSFAQSVNPDFRTVQDLKDDIRKDLEAQRDRMKVTALRDQIGDLLVQNHPFEVSQRQIETTAAGLAEEAHHLMHRMGVQHEENEEHFKALHESSMKKAKRDIQLSYLLQKIARDQKFEVNASEIEARFEELAKRTGFSVPQIKQYYGTKEEGATFSRMERLKIDILDEKSLDYALSKATIKIKGS